MTSRQLAGNLGVVKANAFLLSIGGFAAIFLSRRRLLKAAVLGGLLLGAAPVSREALAATGSDTAGTEYHRFGPTEELFLDELERTAALYFWEAADPATGLVKDRSRADGRTDPREIASIAATGFGLTALCIADRRRYLDRTKIRERVLTILRFLSERLPH